MNPLGLNSLNLPDPGYLEASQHQGSLPLLAFLTGTGGGVVGDDLIGWLDTLGVAKSLTHVHGGFPKFGVPIGGPHHKD